MIKKPISKMLNTFFGIGQFGSMLTVSMHIYIGAFFITDIAKLPVAAYTLISMVSLIVASVALPMIGVIMSKSKAGKFGRTRKWLIIFPVLGILPFVLCYTNIGTVTVSTIIILIAYSLTAIFSSGASLAEMSMVSVVGSNPQERALLSSRFALWQNIGKLAFSISSAMLIVFFISLASGNEALGYTYMAIAAATIWMLTLLIEFSLTKGYDIVDVSDSSAENKSAQNSGPTMGQIVKNIFTNLPLGIASIATFAQQFIIAVLSTLVIYYYTYVAEQFTLYALHLTITNLAAVIASWITPMIARKTSNKTAVIISFILICVGLIICKIYGVSSPYVFMAASTLIQFGMAIFIALNAALFGDCAVYAEWKTGINSHASIMSLLSTIALVANFFRAILIGAALTMAGYVAGMMPTLEVKVGLVNAYVVVPLIFAVIGLVSMFFYSLTNEKLHQMQEEISARQ